MISQKGQYLHLLLPPLDVVISEPEFSMTGPFQHGKEIFSCDEYLFVQGCICATERLLLLFDTTAHHGCWNP